MNQKFRLYFFSGILLLLGASCSTKKNTIFSRSYHNLTAHYNGFFNARERVNEGAKTLAASHEDKYDRLLTVFKYATTDKAKAIFPDMDEAIKKSSIVVQRHSMLIGGKERCNWIPDNYLVIGRAQFYKHDYWTSIETFQYIASSYREKPIRYEALVWLMNSYLELGKTPDAEYLVDFLKNAKDFPKKQRGFFAATSANLYILKNDYSQAIQWLEKAVAQSKKKADRARYSFILAQLYQKTNQSDKAFATYGKVIKLNPEYEMEFNAKIARARSFDVNSANAADVKTQLMKMLKDPKNQEYLDQIYYALAGVAQKENNTDLALEYLHKSVDASLTNTNQKAISYLDMAELYFRKPDYRSAQTYYDSAATFLSPDYPDYSLVINKKTNLSRLIKNLNIIAGEDSLQALALKSPAERQAIVDDLIKKEEDESKKLKELEEQQKKDEQEQKLDEQEFQNSANFNVNKEGLPNNNSVTGSSWYFYNQSAISFGYNEFLKKWGNRKLEDNWRRSSKQELISNNNENPESENSTDSSEAVAAALNDSISKLDAAKRKDAYLNKIPATPELLLASNERLVEAYYNAGLVYRENLDDNKEAAQTFEAMLGRFPENKYKLPVYYNLYRSYLAVGDSVNADKYKKIILEGYAESEYAHIISNPDYYKDNLRRTAIMQVFYENTYKAYLNGQFETVIERKAMADSMSPGNALAPKFAFLKAMSLGKIQGIPQGIPRLSASLNQLILDYPKDSVSILAKDILDKINGVKIDTTASAPVEAVDSNAYRYFPEQEHYVMVVYGKNNKLNTNDLKLKLSNFNVKYYSTQNLALNEEVIGKDLRFTTVKKFADAEKAMAYYRNLKTEKDIPEANDPTMVTIFLMSDFNFSRFISSRDVNKYELFFEKNYK